MLSCERTELSEWMWEEYHNGSRIKASKINKVIERMKWREQEYYRIH